MRTYVERPIKCLIVLNELETRLIQE